MKTKKPKFYFRCFLCENDFQFGPHIYDGRNIPAWGIMVCLSCYTSNCDGIARHFDSKLVAHLESPGAPISRNDKGSIDFPS